MGTLWRTSLRKRSLAIPASVRDSVAAVEPPYRVAIKDWLAIVGIVLAGLWALWSFAWEQRIKPQYFEEPSIKLSITATRAFANGEASSLSAIPVVINGTIENVSKRKLYLEPTRIWVMGEMLNAQAAPRELSPDDESLLQAKRDVAWDRFYQGTSEVIHITNTLAAEWSLPPGESATFSEVAWIPTNKFHQVQVNVYVLAFDRKEYCAKIQFLKSPDVEPKAEAIEVGIKDKDHLCSSTKLLKDADSGQREHTYQFAARTMLALPAIAMP